MTNTSRLHKQAEDESKEEDIGSSLLGTTLLSGGAGALAVDSIKRIKADNKLVKEYRKDVSKAISKNKKDYLTRKPQLNKEEAEKHTSKHKDLLASNVKTYKDSVKRIKNTNNVRKGIAGASILGGGALIAKEYNKQKEDSKSKKD